MPFLKLSVMTHAFQLASADAGTLLTGDLRESFSDRQFWHSSPPALIHLAQSFYLACKLLDLTWWLISGLVLKGLFSNRMEHLGFFLWQPGGMLLFYKETAEQMFSTLIHSSCGKNFFLYIHTLSIGYMRLFYLQYLGRIFGEWSGNNTYK